MAPRHQPRKRFGQHFLVDAGVIEAIAGLISAQPGQYVVEIGPGLGALTRPLLERAGQLHVIELDRDLARRLRGWSGLTVIEADVLNVDFRALLDGPLRRLRIVGNLPYNISTPILFHLLEFADVIEDQHFMLQREVVERMIAQPCTAQYGRLSVMLQWRYEMANLLPVAPSCFDPPPRVDSAIVRMVPRAAPAMLEVQRLSDVVRVAFSQRRKLLRHTLGRWLEDRQVDAGFDLQRRAEEVAVSEYIALAQRGIE